MSVALHAVLMIALAANLDWREPRPVSATAVSIKAQAIDQRVIDEQNRLLEQAQQARELEQQRERERVAAEKRAEEARVAEQERRVEEARLAEIKRKEDEQRRLEEVRKAEEQRVADELREAEEARKAEERRKAEQARKEEEARKAEEKRKAEEARKAEEKRKADEKRKAEAAARKQREDLLADSLQRELDREAAVSSGLLAEYQAMVTQKVRRNWNRPAGIKDDLKCVVKVVQIVGGEVVEVEITKCNGDAAVRRSIEAAIYKASPLPKPPDPSLFERVLEVIFVP